MIDDYQLEAIKRALKRKRFGVFFQQRVGKSRVAIYFIKALFTHKDIKKALIVCPLISRYVWKQEIEKLTGYSVKLINTKKDTKDIPDNTICVINYDKLTNLIDDLRKSKFEIVVADEVHMIKNRTSKRSKQMAKLGRDAEYTLGLTGTPYSNESGSKEHTSFKDLFGIYRFIDPNIFGTRWQYFQDTYCVMGGYMSYNVVKYKNVDRILEMVDESSMRVLRSEVMKEPTQTDVPVMVDLSTKAFKMYKEFEKEAIIALDSLETISAELAITHRMRLQQFCGGFVKTDDSEEIINIHKAKLNMLKKLVSDTEDKLIVSFKYTKEIELAQETFPKALVITGKVSEKNRQKVIEEFKTSEVQILLVQEQTISVSLELSFCDKIVFYSVGDDLITHSQIRDRLMGRFQKADEVFYYYLMCDRTIDKKIFKALKNNVKKSELYANWKQWLKGE